MGSILRSTKKVPTIDDHEDIILEILYKQPLKSLARFRCVSRTWNKRIQDFCIPKVMKQQDVQLLVSCIDFDFEGHVHYVDNRRVLYNSCSDFLPSPATAGQLIDSCNGLLLLWNSGLPWGSSMVVCNPMTKKYFLISNYNPQNISYNFEDAALAFDSYVSPHYKIVSFQYLNRHRQLIVFSSKSWKWKPLKLEFKEYDFTNLSFGRKSVYFNGAIYKLCEEFMVKFLIDDDDEEKSESDRLQAVKLPTKNYPGKKYCYGVSNGSLYFARVDYDDENLKIWILNGSIGGEHCEWMLKHKISCQSIRREIICKWKLEQKLALRSVRRYEGYFTVHACAFHPFADVIFLGCDGVGRYPNIYCYTFSNGEIKPHRKLFCTESEPNLFQDYSFHPFLYCIDPFGFDKKTKWTI